MKITEKLLRNREDTELRETMIFGTKELEGKFFNIANKVIEIEYLRSHPQRKEIVLAVFHAQGEKQASAALKILKERTIENDYNLLFWVKMLTEARSEVILSVINYMLNRKGSELSEEDRNTLLIALSNSEDSNAINVLHLMENRKYLNKTNGIEILELLLNANEIKGGIITDYLCFHSLGKPDLKVVKIISEYKNITKLTNAREKVFGSSSFMLEDERFKNPILDTFEYFKNDDENTQMFSCVELFDKETDPTVSRGLNELYEQILQMPKETQIKVLSLTRNIVDNNKRNKKIK